MLGGHLRLDDQFCCEQALTLVLRSMRAIHHVRDELWSEGKRYVVTVDRSLLFLVYEEGVVALLLHRQIHILTDFDVALCAKNEETAIAPGSKPIRCKSVEPHITESAVAAQHHVTEVLEARVLGVCHVCHLRLDDLGLG